MRNEIGLQLFDFKNILQCMCQSVCSGTVSLKTLCYAPPNGFHSMIESYSVGQIAKSVRGFHQTAQAIAAARLIGALRYRSR